MDRWPMVIFDCRRRCEIGNNALEVKKWKFKPTGKACQIRDSGKQWKFEMVN